MDEKALKRQLEDSAALLKLLDGLVPDRIDPALISYLEAVAEHPWLLEKMFADLPSQASKVRLGKTGT